ncbi:DUF922 domain-containing protein [Salinimicrobium terrae]|uniref:DUF922 domain-containing protein n=1 Tax=Salinimicrobium terrae TaxID=470866 RepID=UPI0003F60B38|nr:DUF922 domain-containing protein [Salinimicrobium terrae]
MKKAVFSSLFFLMAFVTQAQTEESRLAWEANALTWEDFQSSPDPNSPFTANTSSGISYSWSLKSSILGKEYQFEVLSFFNPERSWVKNSGSDHLLAHEQLHFDITELHARKLRKALAEFDFNKSKNVKTELQKIYRELEGERAAMQKKFDLETRHSMEEAAQLEWQQFVTQELKKFENFSS